MWNNYVTKELDNTDSYENKHIKIKLMESKNTFIDNTLNEIPQTIINNNVIQTQNDFRCEILANDSMSVYQKKK